MLHEQAIYQHDGECWQVERFDYENHKAFVRKVEPDYWTDAMTYAQVCVIEESATGVARSADASAEPWPSGWGEVAVVEKVVGYKKIKFYTHENAGYGDVRLPEMQMHTTAFWLTVPEARARARSGPAAPRRSTGCAAIGVALETVVDARAHVRSARPRRGAGRRGTGATRARRARRGCPRKERGGPRPGYSPTLFLYEHVPGGTGLAERICEQRDVLLARTRRMIESCPCPAGCPACVGPGRRFAQGRRDRAAARGPQLSGATAPPLATSRPSPLTDSAGVSASGTGTPKSSSHSAATQRGPTSR